MALSDHGQYSGVVDIARNGIDEVIRLQAQAKQDDALIRQLVEALENSHATLWEEDDDPERPAHAAIAAARARLLEADLAKLTERGAVAWKRIDPQDLRDGGKP